MKKLTCVSLLVMTPVLSWAQAESPIIATRNAESVTSVTASDPTKLFGKIIAKIQAGQVLELLVRIEHADIYEKEKERRRLAYVSPRQLFEGTRLDLDARKNEIFLSGPLSDISVLENSPNVPLLKVRVPDMRTLERLISHPRIIAVMEEVSVTFSPLHVTPAPNHSCAYN